MRYRDNLPLISSNLVRIMYVVGSAVVLQLYLSELGASPFVIALLEVVFWAATLMFSPLWGAASDVSGLRTGFLLASTGLAAATLFLYAFAGSVLEVLGTRFLFAVVAVGFPPIALAAMSVSSAEAERGRDLAPYHTSRAVGFLIGWGAAGVVLDFLGFRSTFYLLGMVATAGFLITFFVRGIDSPDEARTEEIWENARSRWIPSVGDGALTANGLHYLYTGIFLRKTGFIGLYSLIAVYAVDQLGHTASMLGLVLALNPATQLLFIDLFGTLADNHGRRKVLLTGFLFSIPIPFMLLIASNPVIFGAAYVLLGFSFAAIAQGSTAFIGDVAPEHRQGELMGFRKSAQGLAGVIGPLLAGGIATVFSYQLMLIVMGIMTVAGFMAVWYGTEESMEVPDRDVSLRKDVYETVGYYIGT